MSKYLYFGETCKCGGRILYVKLVYPKASQIIMYCENCCWYRRLPLSKNLAEALGIKPRIPGHLLFER